MFDEGRYFDVFIEYAKAACEDILMQVTVHNRGPDEASLHVLPTIWFRHTWSWAGGDEVPSLSTEHGTAGSTIVAEHSVWAGAGFTPRTRVRSSSPVTRPTTSGPSAPPTRCRS